MKPMPESRVIIAALLLFMLSGCQALFPETKDSEYAVIFSALPRILGGGLKEKTVGPGQRVLIMPWETLYRIDTSAQWIMWAGKGEGTKQESDDYVQTRSLDGNEVGLEIVIRFRVDPEKIRHVVQYVGTSNEALKKLVSTVARADIRTHMNVLRTREFFDVATRQAAISQVQKALNTRLEREGIIVDEVIYNTHRFERLLPDGKVDATYQEQIDQTQAINQETEKERKRVAAVVEQKKREFNETQGRVNRLLAEAQGYKEQATLRGDGYLKAKSNQAQQVTAVGNAEVEGMKAQVGALNGPGGEALVKLALAKSLQEKAPNFVLLNAGDANRQTIDFQKTDTNDLLKQLGVVIGAAQAAQETKKENVPSSENTAPANAAAAAAR